MENLNSFENNNYYLLVEENSGFNFNNNNFSLKLAELSVFSAFFLGFLGLSLLTCISLTAYNKRYKNVLLQFVAFSISVLIIVINANDFALIFLGFELQAIAIYALCSIKKNFVFSLESGLKYFILGSLSAGYFLFGWNLLYGITGLSMLVNFHSFFLNFFLCIYAKISLESNNLFEISYGTKNQTSCNYLELKQIKTIFLLTIKEFLLIIKTQITVQIEGISFLISQQPCCCACKPEEHPKNLSSTEYEEILYNKNWFSSRKYIENVQSTLINLLVQKAEELPYSQREVHYNATRAIARLSQDWELNLEIKEKLPNFSLLTNRDVLIKKFLILLEPFEFFNQKRLNEQKLLISDCISALKTFHHYADMYKLNGEKERCELYNAAKRSILFFLRKYKDDPNVELCYSKYNYDSTKPDVEFGKAIVRVLYRKEEN